MGYNYEAYYEQVYDMLSDPNKTISDIFANSKEYDPIYKKILSDGVLRLIISSNIKKPLNKEVRYFWDQFSTEHKDPLQPYKDYRRFTYDSVENRFKDGLIIMKCIDAKTPFNSIEKGDFLELGKMYIWYSKDPNISCYGDAATTIWHSDYSYAGKYCLARFESLYRIPKEDLPKQLLAKIYHGKD